MKNTPTNTQKTAETRPKNENHARKTAETVWKSAEKCGYCMEKRRNRMETHKNPRFEHSFFEISA